MSDSYKYPLDDCDVRDKASLREFRKTRDDWIFWLRGDDQHSIWNQIYNMVWNDAVFRIINESRRIGVAAPTSHAANSGLLGNFMDQGYVATQALAIRRLVESKAKRDERQPISIRRLLIDIRKHRRLITRENFVAYDALPYDYESVASEWSKKTAEKAAKGEVTAEWLATEGPEAFNVARRLHEQFDRLSGITRENRGRNDLLSETIFDQVSRSIAISEIDEVGKFADKFIAHASDPNSRSTLTEQERGVSMAKISTCHKALVGAANAISSQLLWDSAHVAMPIPQLDFLELLDAPWVPTGAMKELRSKWDERVEQVRGWTTPELRA